MSSDATLVPAANPNTSTGPQSVSALGPVDPASVPNAENEQQAPWIVRKLVASMTGRIVVASYETLRTTGTSVVCLSPWGDSSPLLLPCIRFRDLAVHAAIVATGGAATIAAPIMGPVSDLVISSFGDTILVELGTIVGQEAATTLGDEALKHGVEHAIPVHSRVLETTAVKTLTITLMYKNTQQDATLGFFRSSLHQDPSLFTSVKDYLAVEKGWFSPYLFASGRRPAIPRSMTPDVVFCHGPFLQGDYRVGQTLLAQSTSAIHLCSAPATPATETAAAAHTPAPHAPKPAGSGAGEALTAHASKLLATLHLPTLDRTPFARSRTPSPEPQLTALPVPPTPRRLVLLALGLKPHRAGLWTSSQRPGESVLRYVLLSGCPAVVMPAKLGAPLVAWHAETMEALWKVRLPADDAPPASGKAKIENKDGELTFEGAVAVLYEFAELCIDWDRVEVPGDSDASEVQSASKGGDEQSKRAAVRDAMRLLVAAAVRSGESKTVRKEVDKERAGIAMWRIP